MAQRQKHSSVGSAESPETDPCPCGQPACASEGRAHSGGKIVSPVRNAGDAEQPHAKGRNLNTLIPYIKISSEWIGHLNLRLDTITLS